MNILLADDDTDDCNFFKKAAGELPFDTNLSIVRDGELLMNYLHENALPDILFLDLSMPRKTGFECLCEIKENERLKDLNVVMFSTAFPQDKNYEEGMVTMLLKLGAHHFIRKPNDIEQLKSAIHHAITLVKAK